MLFNNFFTQNNMIFKSQSLTGNGLAIPVIILLRERFNIDDQLKEEKWQRRC